MVAPWSSGLDLPSKGSEFESALLLVDGCHDFATIDTLVLTETTQTGGKKH